jgi:hypothetical protein
MKILHFTILSPTIYTTKKSFENANLVGINLELDATREIDKIESEKLARTKYTQIKNHCRIVCSDCLYFNITLYTLFKK